MEIETMVNQIITQTPTVGMLYIVMLNLLKLIDQLIEKCNCDDDKNERHVDN